MKTEVEKVLEVAKNLSDAIDKLTESFKPFFDGLAEIILEFYNNLTTMVRRQLLYVRLRGNDYPLEFCFWVSQNLPEYILDQMFSGDDLPAGGYKETGLTFDDGEFCEMCGRNYDSRITGEYPCDKCGMPLRIDEPEKTDELGLY